jgi:hypothetical protein
MMKLLDLLMSKKREINGLVPGDMEIVTFYYHGRYYNVSWRTISPEITECQILGGTLEGSSDPLGWKGMSVKHPNDKPNKFTGMRWAAARACSLPGKTPLIQQLHQDIRTYLFLRESGMSERTLTKNGFDAEEWRGLIVRLTSKKQHAEV